MLIINKLESKQYERYFDNSCVNFCSFDDSDKVTKFDLTKNLTLYICISLKKTTRKIDDIQLWSARILNSLNLPLSLCYRNKANCNTWWMPNAFLHPDIYEMAVFVLWNWIITKQILSHSNSSEIIQQNRTLIGMYDPAIHWIIKELLLVKTARDELMIVKEFEHRYIFWGAKNRQRFCSTYIPYVDFLYEGYSGWLMSMTIR